MKNINCDELIDAYSKWLRTNITLVDLDDVCEITTPFLDRHNDRLQIYVKSHEGHLRLSDDSYVIGDLKSSGCKISSPSHKKTLQVLLNGFGVQIDDGELFVDTSAEDFPRKVHNLLQAMIAVNNMFLTSRHRVSTTFVLGSKRPAVLRL